MSEKQIVDAFKAFFEKSVLPSVAQNDQIMREWSHLDKIISSQPIDYSQVQFYLLLANKASSNSPTLQVPKPNLLTVNNNSKLSQNDNRYRRNEYTSPSNGSDRYQEKKRSQIGSTSHKKKNLVGSLQNFQRLLVQNQQRLELLAKKEINEDRRSPPVNNSVNGIQIRRYER